MLLAWLWPIILACFWALFPELERGPVYSVMQMIIFAPVLSWVTLVTFAFPAMLLVARIGEVSFVVSGCIGALSGVVAIVLGSGLDGLDTSTIGFAAFGAVSLIIMAAVLKTG